MARNPWIIYCDTRRDKSVQAHPWRLSLPDGTLCCETIDQASEALTVFKKFQEPTSENVEAWVATHKGLCWIPEGD